VSRDLLEGGLADEGLEALLDISEDEVGLEDGGIRALGEEPEVETEVRIAETVTPPVP